MSASKQPFKLVETYNDDGGFEYMPSEQSSQSNIEDIQNNFIQSQSPYHQSTNQEKLTPSKNVRTSNQTAGWTQQSLVYSASSQDTEVVSSMNSPQFGQQIVQGQPQNYILVNNEMDSAEEDQRRALKVNQMTQNLQNLPLKNSGFKNTPNSNGSNQKTPSQNQSQNNFNPVQKGLDSVIKDQISQRSPQRSNQAKSQENFLPQDQAVKLQQQLQVVEQQLIQERLNSEQLRVYNHIIKHELEKKLINQGVFLIQETKRACKQHSPSSMSKKKGTLRETSTNEAAIDIYLEIQHNRIQMQALVNEFKQKDAIIRHLENQLKQCNEINDLMKRHENDIQEQNDQLTISVQEAMVTVSKANSTISNLEQEKDALCDCVEEQEQIIKDLKMQLEDSKRSEQQIKQQLNQLHDQLNDSKTLLQQHEREQKTGKVQLSQLDGTLQEKDKQLREIEHQKNQLNKMVTEKQKEIQNYQKQLQDSQNQLSEYEQANRDLSVQFNDNIQQLANLKKQTLEQQSQISILNDNLEQVTYEYESNVTKTDRMERQLMESDRLASEREQQLIGKEQQLARAVQKQKQLEEENRKNGKVQQQYQDISSKYDNLRRNQEQITVELEQGKQSKEQEIVSLNEKLMKLQREKNALSEKVNQLNNERQQIIEEMDSGQRNMNSLQERYQRSENELGECKQVLNERNNAQAKLQIFEIKYQADMEYYTKVITELQEKISHNEAKNEDGFSALDDKRIKQLQIIYDKLEMFIVSLSTKPDFNNLAKIKPIYQIDSYLNELGSLVDKIDLINEQFRGSIRVIEERNDYNLKQLTYQIQSKEKEIEYYKHPELTNTSKNQLSSLDSYYRSSSNQNKGDVANLPKSNIQQTVVKRKYFL